jgi:hypothetical protein
MGPDSCTGRCLHSTTRPAPPTLRNALLRSGSFQFQARHRFASTATRHADLAALTHIPPHECCRSTRASPRPPRPAGRSLPDCAQLTTATMLGRKRRSPARLCLRDCAQTGLSMGPDFVRLQSAALHYASQPCPTFADFARALVASLRSVPLPEAGGDRLGSMLADSPARAYPVEADNSRPRPAIGTSSVRRDGMKECSISQTQEPLCSLSPQHRHPLRRTPGCWVPAASRHAHQPIRRPD